LPTDTPAPVRTPTRAPARRPVATRTHTPAPPAPPAVSPTPNPDAGFHYRVTADTCTSGTDTRIVGTVYDHGAPLNGVTVRVSGIPGGEPAIPDFVTGVDPNDPHRVDDSLRGKYRLSLREGGFVAGFFYVTVIGYTGNAQSRTVTVETDAKPGCNIATINFEYP
jgi:hypothetical protein